MESMKLISCLILIVLVSTLSAVEDCCNECRVYTYGRTSYTVRRYVPSESVTITDAQQYKTKCGLLGWGRCVRYRAIYKTVSALKSVQTTLYRQNTISYTCKQSCTCHCSGGGSGGGGGDC